MIINGNSSQPNVDPNSLHETLQGVRQTATTSLTQALTELQTVNALGVSIGKDGVLQLAPPKGAMNVMDITLRIGLLQDALGQLMQQVSKTEIEGRLNDLNRENKDQLDRLKDQMKHLEEAAKKNQEAEKKGNIVSAIGNFFKAALDAVSAVLSLVAAVGYFLSGNMVAAAGLAVAGVALAASFACNLTLAINDVIKASGYAGMDEKHVNNLKKASEILGYVAAAAAMIGGLGAVVSGVRQGAKMAASRLAEAGVQVTTKNVIQVTSTAGKEAMKELLKRGVNESADEVVKEVMKQAFKGIYDLGVRQGIAAGSMGYARTINNAVGGHIVANIKESAADEKLKADQAEAQAKSIEAMITMLRKMIEQLQNELEGMLDSCMQAVSAIYNAADETASSMKDLMHFQTN